MPFSDQCRAIPGLTFFSFLMDARLMGSGAHRKRMDELMDAAMSDMDLMPLFVQVQGRARAR